MLGQAGAEVIKNAWLIVSLVPIDCAGNHSPTTVILGRGAQPRRVLSVYLVKLTGVHYHLQ